MCRAKRPKREQGSCVTSCVNIHYTSLRVARRWCQTRNEWKERPDHYFPTRSVECQRRRDPTMTMPTVNRERTILRKENDETRCHRRRIPNLPADTSLHAVRSVLCFALFKSQFVALISNASAITWNSVRSL